jgi:pilus assembly protein CpaB
MNPLRALYIGLSRIPPVTGIIVIVGLAAVAAGLSAQHIKHIEEQYNSLVAKTQHVAKEKTVFLSRDIKEGELISADALQEKEIASGTKPTDALASIDLVVGRVAKYDLLAGNVVSTRDLVQKIPSTDFESRLSKGMRAVTFAVDTGSGVAGFVSPESRVDIMATVGSGADTKAGTILSNVRVVAVGQTYKRTKDGGTGNPASSVTVEVDPIDAQKLVKAVMASKIYLALRGQSDKTPMATLDIRSLYGKEASDHVVAARPNLPPPPQALNISSDLPDTPQYKVEVWTGKEKNVVHFER